MRHGRALRRAAMAAVFALFALAPAGLSVAKLGFGGPAMAQDGYAEDSFAIDQFYDELAPFGEWVHHPDHGYVWLPRTVAPDWRPYTVGNWVDTDDGWYWDSPEPFAWAVYHYGRWNFDPNYGWYWVPGDTWAPAWVQWRYGDEYVGWAPEPPLATGGYVYGGPARYVPPPPRASWVFVRPRYLASPAVRTYAVPQTVISIAFSRTTYVYRPEYRNGYVYNYGMPRDRWSRLTHQHVEPRKIYRGHSRSHPHDWNRRHHSRDLYVYAPGVKKGAGPRRPPKKVAHKPSKATATKATANKATASSAKALQRVRGYGRGGGKPPQVTRPHAKSKAVNTSTAKTKAQRGRAPGPMTLGSPGGGKPSQVSGWPPAPKAGKPPFAKPNMAKAKEDRPKDAKAGAPRAGPHGPVTLGSPNGGKPPHVSRPPAKPEAATAKPAKAKSAKAKAPKAKAPKPGTAMAKPANVTPKAPKAKAAQAKSGGGKPNAAKGGGNRAAACKAKPDLPFCRRRGG